LCADASFEVVGLAADALLCASDEGKDSVAGACCARLADTTNSMAVSARVSCIFFGARGRMAGPVTVRKPQPFKPSMPHLAATRCAGTSPKAIAETSATARYLIRRRSKRTQGSPLNTALSFIWEILLGVERRSESVHGSFSAEIDNRRCFPNRSLVARTRWRTAQQACFSFIALNQVPRMRVVSTPCMHLSSARGLARKSA
jgi:hypothetical protein